MSAVTIGAMTLSECAKCFGVWVTAARFEQLCADREAQTALLHGGVLRGQEASAGAGAITAAAPQVRYRPCPSCKKLMNRVNFASGARAVLDICREHGTFFDRDELHRVVKFIQEGGLEKARARERQLLQQEQARLRRAHLRPDSAQAMLNPEPLSLRDHAVFESSSDLFNVFVHALIDR
jgi:Zn-finger nucleic acid-binding protein